MTRGPIALAMSALALMALAAIVVLIIVVWMVSVIDVAVLVPATIATIAVVAAAGLYVALVLSAMRDTLNLARQSEDLLRRAGAENRRTNKALSQLKPITAVSFGAEFDKRMLEIVDLIRQLGADQTQTRERMLEIVYPIRQLGADQTQTGQRMLEIVDLIRQLGADQTQIHERMLEIADPIRQLGADQTQTGQRMLEIVDLIRQLGADQTRNEGKVRSSVMTAYEQVEALLALYSVIDPKHPLPPFRGWAVSPDLAAHLVRMIDERRPAYVVEMGSGLSTILMGIVLAQQGEGRLLSLEHEALYAEATREMVSRHGLEEVVRVVHAPLKAIELEGETWRWYDLSTVEFETPIDIAVVDGPPQSVGHLARYPAVPKLMEHLGAEAVVVLDDAARPGEAEVVDRWTERYPEFKLSLRKHEKGTAELQRLG